MMGSNQIPARNIRRPKTKSWRRSKKNKPYWKLFNDVKDITSAKTIEKENFSHPFFWILCWKLITIYFWLGIKQRPLLHATSPTKFCFSRLWRLNCLSSFDLLPSSTPSWTPFLLSRPKSHPTQRLFRASNRLLHGFAVYYYQTQCGGETH